MLPYCVFRYIYIIYYNYLEKNLTDLIGFVCLCDRERDVYCSAGDIIPIIADPGIGNGPGWSEAGGTRSEGIFFEIRERAVER